MPWLGVLSYAGLLVGSVFYIRKNPMITFGILLYLIALAPISNIFFINSTTLGERLLFLPSLGFCICIVLSGWGLASKQSNPNTRKLLLASYPVLMAFFSVLTIGSAAKWKDNITLFQHGVDVSPNSARTHFNLGIAYWDKAQKSSDRNSIAGYTENAIIEMRKSLEIYPEHFMAMTDLGCLYDLKGDFDSSLSCFEKSLKLYADQPVVFTNLSNILDKKGAQLEQTGNLQDAVRYYLESISRDSLNLRPYNSLGLLYARKNDFDSAFVYFNAALAINSEHRKTLENAAVTAFFAKDYDKAIGFAQKHITLYGNSRPMLGVLSDCYYAKGNYAEVMRLRELLEPGK